MYVMADGVFVSITGLASLANVQVLSHYGITVGAVLINSNSKHIVIGN